MQPLGNGDRLLDPEADTGLHRDLGRLAASQQNIGGACGSTHSGANRGALPATGSRTNGRANRSADANLGQVGAGRACCFLLEGLGADADALAV